MHAHDHNYDPEWGVAQITQALGPSRIHSSAFEVTSADSAPPASLVRDPNFGLCTYVCRCMYIYIYIYIYYIYIRYICMHVYMCV